MNSFWDAVSAGLPFRGPKAMYKSLVSRHWCIEGADFRDEALCYKIGHTIEIPVAELPWHNPPAHSLLVFKLKPSGLRRRRPSDGGTFARPVSAGAGEDRMAAGKFCSWCWDWRWMCPTLGNQLKVHDFGVYNFGVPEVTLTLGMKDGKGCLVKWHNGSILSPSPRSEPIRELDELRSISTGW